MLFQENHSSHCTEGAKISELKKGTEKELLVNNMLLGGVEITSEEQFRKIANILKSEGNIDITQLNFNDINEGFPIALKKLNNTDSNVSVFSLYSVFNLNPNGPFKKMGVIENGGKIVHDSSRDIIYTRSEENKSEKLLLSYDHIQGEILTGSKLELCALDSDLKGGDSTAIHIEQTQNEEVSADKESVEVITYIPYKINKGDSLWQIMRSEYGLINPTDIANILNILKKDPQFGITDLNKILKIGQELKLPSKVTIQSKTRETKDVTKK